MDISSENTDSLVKVNSAQPVVRKVPIFSTKDFASRAAERRSVIERPLSGTYFNRLIFLCRLNVSENPTFYSNGRPVQLLHKMEDEGSTDDDCHNALTHMVYPRKRYQTDAGSTTGVMNEDLVLGWDGIWDEGTFASEVRQCEYKN